MVAGPRPPIEWVPSEKQWWVVRIVVPAVVTAAVVLVIVRMWFLSGGQPPTAAQSAIIWGLIIGELAVIYLTLFAFPSVRRIGISPMCLIVDTGLQRFTYSWSDLRRVARTEVRQFRWNQVSSVSGTRISVGSIPFVTYFTLSPNQGDRLAQFLRIP